MDQNSETAAESTVPVKKRVTRRVTTKDTAAADTAAAETAAADTAAAETAAADVTASDAAATVATAAEGAAPVKRRGRPRKIDTAAATATEVTTTLGESADSAAASAAAVVTAEKPAKTRVSRARKKAEKTAEGETPAATAAAPERAADTAVDTTPVSDKVAVGGSESAGNDAAAVAADAETPKAPAKRRGRPRKVDVERAAAAEQAAASEAPAEVVTGESAGNDAAAVAADAETPKAPAKRRGRPRKVDVEQAAAEQAAASEEKAAADGGDTAETAAGATAEQPQETRGRSRTRQRDRKRRGADEIEELTEDDVLLPIAGILDVLDNYAFVRTSGYLPGVSDVYVSLSQVKRHGLRKGDAIVGAIRKPREGEGSGRQKYNALVKIDAVNGTTVEEAQQRPQFEELTPIAPNTPVLIGDAVGTATARAIDMFAPLAFGQRGLLNGASGSGVTATLLEIAAGYAAVSPETHLMFVAVGGRPEETTEIARRINGEVIAAAADRSAEDRTTVVELALERAKRLVEIGHDVVLLLDTLADFSDAIETQTYNPKTSPIFGMNPYTMQLIVDVFAASRNLENSGSLAVYAGVYGVRMFADMERLQRLQNWNLELNSELAQLGVFPAVNVLSSSAKVAAVAHPAALAQQVRQIRMAQHSAGEGDVSAAVELIETLENAESTAAAAAKLSAKK